MTAKHTPGPWFNLDWHISAKSGTVVCNPFNAYGKDGRLIPSDEREANANLIAAAPDLLSFAEHIARICARGEEHGNPHLLLEALGDDARTAIAKAKGEST